MGKRRSSIAKPRPSKAYRSILADLVGLLDAARAAAARTVNAVMTATYWRIGRRIVEEEQGGRTRAGYGEALLRRLSDDLTMRFGRGFSVDNLENMRRFYLAYPRKISETPSRKSLPHRPQGEAPKASPSGLSTVTIPFPLPWSHYVRLMSVKNDLARDFYEAEAIRGGWTIKQLDRQIDSLFYERTALSRDKRGMLIKGGRAQPDDHVDAAEALKDPFVLEFLGLKDEYSESEIEEALIRHLEMFLLELGNDFTFVGRQRRLRVGDQWFRVDLLFFHRRLRCLLIIDLKVGKFTHADAGQMNLYCNYAAEHWTHPDENPPVGLILCAHKDEAVARYALGNVRNDILAAEYRLRLPDEREIAAELDRTRRSLESRRALQAGRPHGKA